MKSFNSRLVIITIPVLLTNIFMLSAQNKFEEESDEYRQAFYQDREIYAHSNETEKKDINETAYLYPSRCKCI